MDRFGQIPRDTRVRTRLLSIALKHCNNVTSPLNSSCGNDLMCYNRSPSDLLPRFGDVTDEVVHPRAPRACPVEPWAALRAGPGQHEANARWMSGPLVVSTRDRPQGSTVSPMAASRLSHRNPRPQARRVGISGCLTRRNTGIRLSWNAPRTARPDSHETSRQGE